MILSAVLEALLTGMPLVINKRQGDQVPEFKNNFILMVGNTVNGYYQALKMLIENNEFRERLGREAFSYAWDHWSPEKTEAKYVKIYNQVVSSRRSDA